MLAQRSFGTRCAGDAGFAYGEGVGGGVGRDRRAGRAAGEAGGFAMSVRGPDPGAAGRLEEGFGRIDSVSGSFKARNLRYEFHKPSEGRS